jgi:hypothetical protein
MKKINLKYLGLLILLTSCTNITSTGEKISTTNTKPPVLKSSNAVVTTLPVILNYYVAIDKNSNIYIANNYAVQKLVNENKKTPFVGENDFQPPIDLTGKRDCPGYADGKGAQAKFCHPGPMTTDSAGNLYVADNYNFMVRKVTPDGIVSTVAGNGTYGFADGDAKKSTFTYISGITLDSDKNIYVTDSGRIRKITQDGQVSTFAGGGKIGYKDGKIKDAEFINLNGIVTDKDNNIFVADLQRIRKITPAGDVTTFAGDKEIDKFTVFSELRGLAIDQFGNLFVCDFFNNRIKLVTPDGKVSLIAGSSMDTKDGTGINASFYRPINIAVDQKENIFITQTDHSIRKIAFK